MTLSITELANLALDVLPAKNLVSINDNTHAAEVCRRHYPQAIAELMEHEWQFATRRASLVSITNTQSTRWGYAYAVPNDMGVPLRVRETDATDYVLGVGQSMAFTGWFADPGITFDIEGQTLYTGASAATLEYITKNPAFADMTASFEKALQYTLAARIAMPITKDERKTDSIFQKAELVRDRALAADLNRNATANTYGTNYVPEHIADHLWAPE